MVKEVQDLSVDYSTVYEPLHARRVWALLGETFRMYRGKFSFLILTALCILVPYHIVTGIVQVRFASQLNSEQFSRLLVLLRTQGSASYATNAAHPFVVAALIWTYGIVFMYAILVSPFLYGMILHMTERHVLKRKGTELGEASTYALSRLLPNLVTLLLLVLLFLIASTVVAVGVGLLSTASSSSSMAIVPSIVLGAVLFCALIWCLVKLSFVPSVVIAEKSLLWRAIARSWCLTKRSFWRLVGYFLMLYFMTYVLRAALVAAVLFLIPNAYVTLVASTVIDIFVLPFTMLATAVMYTDLRIRTDGLVDKLQP